MICRAIVKIDNKVQSIQYEIYGDLKRPNLMQVSCKGQNTNFKCLRVTVSSDRNVTKEVRSQANKAAGIAGYSCDIVWRNI